MSELIFVYNAKSGIMNGLIHWTHKIISPESYVCVLCSLTYNNFGKINKWKSFLNSLELQITFLYKDQIKSKQTFFKNNLPCVYLVKEKDNKILMSSKELNLCKDLDSLIITLRKRLEEFS